jgi:hypothetical protein
LIRPSEQIIVSAEGHCAQGALGTVVFDLDDAVDSKACERFPSRQRIADRDGKIGLRRYLGQDVFEPTIQGIEQRS